MKEDDLLSSLNKHFKYDSFRPGQQPIIRAVLKGKDVIVCKESGFGKSLCFQLPAMMRDGLVVVITTSLQRVKRECHELRKLKITCGYLNRDTSKDKDCRTILNSSKGNSRVWEQLQSVRTSSGLKFLYVTIDYFVNCDKLRRSLKDIYANKLLQALVVDEIHFKSQWLDSFKVEYSNLGYFRDAHPKVPILCFTSPLSQEKFLTVKDILHLQEPYMLNEPSARTNVSYEVMYIDKELSIPGLVKFIKTRYRNKSGLVYCFDKEYGKVLVESLQNNDVSSVNYTRSLSDEQIDRMIFGSDKTVIVCLSGLPVNLDSKRLDFVIHVRIPFALDIYIEETSKVGKNGDRGTCVLFYWKEDPEKHLNSMIAPYKKKISKVNSGTKRQLFDELKDYRKELLELTLYAENESLCRQVMMLKYLNDENFVEPCGVCDVCSVMKESFVVDMSGSLKKILWAIWTINKYQKGIKSDDYVFGSMTLLVDLFLGISRKHTSQLSGLSFFGSFASWDPNTLHRLIVVALIQKFASVNLIVNDDFAVYQNLIITTKGQQFAASNNEFGIPFSCKDVRITKWLNSDWVRNQYLNDLTAVADYYRKFYFRNLDYKRYCDELSKCKPSVQEEFNEIKKKFNCNEEKYSDLNKDLFNICLMYHRILQSNY